MTHIKGRKHRDVKEEERREAEAKRQATTLGGGVRKPLRPSDPAREELRQKQLREDPLFTEKVAIVDQRRREQAQAQAQEELKTPEQRAIEKEKERLIEEETPQRLELTPEISLLEKFPVLGGTFGVIKDRLQEVVLLTVPKGKFREAFKENLGIAQADELRTLALSQIEQEQVDIGLSASEKFGATIEGIPIIGSLATQYAGGLIETPSENARQVKTDLLKEKRRISNIETNVKLGYLPVSVATEQLTDIENNVQRLESRLKVLINNSPELKFNQDLVNTYETEILLTREKIFQGKLNVLTGATQNPTELQILQQLSLQGEEE